MRCDLSRRQDLGLPCHVALGISLEENLAGIKESVEAVVASGREALLDCEHFFDGYKANPDYALLCAKTAYEAGARWVVLCDTNGGTLPEEVEAIVTEVVKLIPGDHIGIHVHNDTDNGVANSLAAVRAGARQIQGTLNGLGERCGNANLTSIIPTLMLKADYAERYETSVTPEKLQDAHPCLAHPRRGVEPRARTGMRLMSAERPSRIKAASTSPPCRRTRALTSMCRRRRSATRGSCWSRTRRGRSNILAELDRIGIKVPKDDPRVGRLLDAVKERESQGYAYEAAEASFELLARRMLGNVPQFFDVESFRVLVERRHNAEGELVTVSEATVKVRIDGETVMSVGEGNGPVNALDMALRKDLGRYQSYISDLELVDYKVRILTGGTDAVTRVLVESRDGAGRRWFTVGVSPNIVDASFEALIDSINYKLIRDAAPAA